MKPYWLSIEPNGINSLSCIIHCISQNQDNLWVLHN